MPREHLLKIGVSGIRGVVGEFLTPALACAFAQAFGTYVGAGRVRGGPRYPRRAGQMLEHAVQCGLLAAGCEVIDVGVLPTPTIQMYVGATRAPRRHRDDGFPQSAGVQRAEAIQRARAFLQPLRAGRADRSVSPEPIYQAENQEIRTMRRDYERGGARCTSRGCCGTWTPAAIRARGFHVALDGVNGAGSVMTPRFLTETLGCDLDAISVDPDKAVSARGRAAAGHCWEIWPTLVREKRCEIGFAQDPDGDRLAVVDETGHVLDNDDVLALAVDAALARLPGDVVVNLTTSSVIDDVAAAHGSAKSTARRWARRTSSR